MSRRLLLPLAFFLTAVAVGVGLHTARRAQDAQALALAAAQQRDDLRLRYQRIEARLAGMERIDADLQQLIARERTAAREAEAAAAQAAKAAAASRSDSEDLVLTNPTVRASYLKIYAEGLDAEWGLMFRALALTPEKAAQFKAIMVRYEQDRIDVFAMAAAKKIAMDDAIVRKQQEKDGHDQFVRMQELLGPDDFKTYNQFNHAKAVLPFVEELAADLFYGDNPLQADQAQELVRILQRNSEKTRWGFARNGTLNWDQTFAEAQTVLAPAQVNALRQIKELRQTQRQVSQLMDAVRRNQPPAVP